MTNLFHAWAKGAPTGSLFAVELEQNTELGVLPSFLEWQVRRYAPAQVAIAEVLEKGDIPGF